MTKTALIDLDMVAYRCAASAELEPVDVALERADSLIERIVYDTSSDCMEGYLTGSTNFRSEIYPQYKANRQDKPRPRWLQDVREHLVLGWGARVTDGVEADDELGISQCAGDNTVICTNDKDLLMIPGYHYNPVTGEHRLVSPLQGMQHFYYQLIMGDSSDNIMGYDYKARSKVPKFLEPTLAELTELDEESDMYSFVAALYHDHSLGSDDWIARMHTNGKCLWIWRKQGDIWQPPGERNEQETLPSNLD